MYQSAFTWPFCSLSLAICGLGVSLLPPLEKGHLSWLVVVAASVLLGAPRNQMIQVTLQKMRLIANKGESIMYVHIPVESSFSTAGFHGFQNLSTIGCRNLCQSHKTTGITIQEMQTILTMQYFEWLLEFLPFYVYRSFV